jgi:nucleoside-diphosphate-sugar epimerase
MGKQIAIVFGGAGFIGRYLLLALSRQGYTTLCADIRPLDPPIPGVHAVICDVRQEIPATLGAAELGDSAGKDAIVYNLAAVHRTPGHPDREYYDTNVSGALEIAEYCRRRGINEIVFTSSISIYGPSESEKAENTEPQPESSYGASKLQAEAIHRAWQGEKSDRRLVIARPAVIFGPGENGNFTRLAKALRQRRFMYPGRRDTIKACGYVDELVSSFEFARKQTPYFLYNFCYPANYTIQDICDAFHDVGGLPRPVGTVPLAPMLALGAGFEGLSRIGIATDINRARIDKLVRSTRIRPAALLDAGYEYQTDISSAIARWREASNGKFV